MKARGFVRLLFGCALLALAAAACSGSDGPTEVADGASVSCVQAAQEVIDVFDTFLEPYSALTPDEFFASPELEGLESFQDQVAAIVVRVSQNPNDDCTEADLEDEVDAALTDYAGQGLLNRYLVGAVQTGLQAEQRDVLVTPDDDLLTILPLLGPGSSVTFSEGTFSLNATLLVQTDLVLVGAGATATVLESSADSAAIAVLGEGNLIVNDMAIEHTGDAPASVIIAVDAPVQLQRVDLSGAIADEEGAGGSGLVLAGAERADQGTAAPSAEVRVVIADSSIHDNQAAGVAVTVDFAPTIAGNVINANEQCGICLFDHAGGVIRDNIVQANTVGIQTSGSTTVEVSDNTFIDNGVAGMLIEVDSTSLVIGNRFTGVGIVGIDVQGQANPELISNTFEPHAVAISLRAESTPTVLDNVIKDADVGVLVGGTAEPVVQRTSLSGSTVAGFLHTEESKGSFSENTIDVAEGAAVVVEGTASPEHLSSTMRGGLVGLVFRESATGVVADNMIEGNEVGLEAGDESVPQVVRNTFVGNTAAGVIFSGDGAGVFRENMLEPIEIGIQLGGAGEPTVENNTVLGGDTGALVTEASRGQLVSNSFTDQNFGIGVSGTAEPLIEDNEIQNALAGAMSFEGETGGVVTGNRVIDAGVVGIRIAGSAAPTIENNSLFALVAEPAAEPDPEDPDTEDPEDPDTEDPDTEDPDTEDPVPVATSDQSGAGLLFAEDATGVATNNQIFGFVIGIQVSDSAAPELIDNRADGAGVGGVGLLYGVNGGGRAENNLSVNQQIGFQLSGLASPELTGNTVESVAAAAFLLQGEATPQLQDNSCPVGFPGIVLLEQSNPELAGNNCEVLRQ